MAPERMRAAAPYQVNPRQLRALVLLLALLPLVPATFVIRFLVEDIRTERAEARDRAKEVYRKFLTATRKPLAAFALRQIPLARAGAPATDPWSVFAEAESADTILLLGPHGKLAVPPPATNAPPLTAAAKERQIAALQVADTILETGPTRVSLIGPDRLRWRFLAETPDPLFSVQIPAGIRPEGTPENLLLVASRRRLLDQISAYYQKLVDSKSLLRVIDENGDESPLVAHDPAAGVAGEELAEMSLPAPWPAWRIELFSIDATLVDGIMHEQVVSYARLIGGMLALTFIIAAVAGWTLSRRIAFHELSNDALATVAHEMKTPLSSTRMLLETLLEGRYAGGPAQVEEYLRLMASENGRLERLVQSFQILGRLEHSHGPGAGLRLVPIPVSEIIEDARVQLLPRLQATGCTLEVRIWEPPPVVRADRDALTSAVVNLLDNAAKYSEPGKQISVCASTDAEGVLMEVEDEGIGIEPAEQERIFERFYQSDRRLSRTYGGCGLGLNIVQSVVRLHGGRISVRSALGRGSTFVIRLPGMGGATLAADERRPAFGWWWRRRSAS